MGREDPKREFLLQTKKNFIKRNRKRGGGKKDFPKESAHSDKIRGRGPNLKHV